MYNQNNTLSALVDASLAIEKLRMASTVRQTHLKLKGKDDPETDEMIRRIAGLEDYVDGRVAKLISTHPAYPWFSKVKGVGKENIGKVVTQVRIKPEDDGDGGQLKYADTISALWKFCGYSVDGGRAPKRVKGGGKLCYNSQLRSMCWRLGSSLMRAKGKFYEYYLEQKDRYVERYENQGVKMVPAANLPEKNSKKYEPENTISEGHMHNQALRKMIKLFLACLWLVWREAEGLPATKPYAIDQLKHDSLIDPWKMVDK